MKKSAKQLEREAARAEERERRQAAQAASGAEREQVRLYHGDAFAPAGDVEVVDAGALQKPPAPLPFKLTGDQRLALQQGKPPRIAFPRSKPCPVTVGEVYPVAPSLWFVVTGIRETRKDHELHYEVHDERVRGRHLGRGVGYASSTAGAIPTEQAPDPGDGPREGQFRPEREPEALTQKEQTKMSDTTRAERIKEMAESLRQQKDNLAKLERLPGTGEVCWAIRRAITALEGRIKREGKLLKAEAPGEAA